MIWFDVTEIKNWQGHHTGIQRVIAKLGELLKDDESFALCYFDYSTNMFRLYDYDFGEEIDYGNDSNNAIAVAKTKLQSIAEKLKKKSPLTIKNGIKRIVSVTGIRHGSVRFASGDVLFIPGAFWVYSFDHLRSLKHQYDISVVGIMYDLVPIVTPHFTAQVTVEGFNARFQEALGTFDYWFAISSNTKRDMIDAAKERGIRLEPNVIEVIRLGDVIDDTSKAIAKPEGFDFQPEGFCLLVSTIEARKNQTLVYQAVKRLQEKKANHLPIVLVGKHGWLSDDIIYILKNDPTIKDKLVWLSRVDDKSLRWLYENCAFTIYPPYYEGWGLPVAESLAYGKTCIASNASSIPEVAGDLIEYFSPYSSDELADLLIKYSETPYRNKRNALARKFKITLWSACAQHVGASLHVLNKTSK